jgi:hypothetical protein
MVCVPWPRHHAHTSPLPPQRPPLLGPRHERPPRAQGVCAQLGVHRVDGRHGRHRRTIRAEGRRARAGIVAVGLPTAPVLAFRVGAATAARRWRAESPCPTKACSASARAVPLRRTSWAAARLSCYRQIPRSARGPKSPAWRLEGPRTRPGALYAVYKFTRRSNTTVVGYSLKGKRVQAPGYLYTILKVKILEVASYLTSQS